MTRGERRRRRMRKIKQRINLVMDINHFEADLREPGYFSNNNEMNRWGGGGRSKKTKARHGHASYRHKGDYGKAINYAPHDLKQVQDMEFQEEDFSAVNLENCQ